MKRFAVISLCVIMLLGFTLPASAAEWSGNGYHRREFLYNEKTYNYILAIEYNPTYGMRANTTCNANGVQVQVFDVSAKFDTKHYGYVNNSGSSMSGTFMHNTLYTEWVKCPYGMQEVISLKQGKASATINIGKGYPVNATYAS